MAYVNRLPVVIGKGTACFGTHFCVFITGVVFTHFVRIAAIAIYRAGIAAVTRSARQQK